VERPEDLAEWLLRGIDGWTRERIGAAITGTKTVTVTLERPVPVLIVYATAVALEGGEVRFFPDIYGQDAQLGALVKGYPRHPLTPRTDAAPPASAPAGVRP
jgi:murein L,D-transpeptidase YcbB/YkuD